MWSFIVEHSKQNPTFHLPMVKVESDLLCFNSWSWLCPSTFQSQAWCASAPLGLRANQADALRSQWKLEAKTNSQWIMRRCVLFGQIWWLEDSPRKHWPAIHDLIPIWPYLHSEGPEVHAAGCTDCEVGQSPTVHCTSADFRTELWGTISCSGVLVSSARYLCDDSGFWQEFRTRILNQIQN